MLIRPAAADDVPRVLAMVEKICALHETWNPVRYGLKPGPAERYRRWLGARCADQRSVFLVAEADPNLIAFLVATGEMEIPIYTISECGFIHDLWVEERYRNEGIARQMTMLALEKFADLGIRQVRLQTAAANAAGRDLFTACGFRPGATEMLIELDQSV